MQKEKKIITILMALVLAGALGACNLKTDNNSQDSSSVVSSEVSSQDDMQNPVMNFVGPYVCEKADMNVEAVGKTDAKITVQWSNGAAAYTKWEMSGTLDVDTLKLNYQNCKKTEVVMNEDGSIGSETVEYENGKGRIVFHEDGTATWEDDEEQVADGMVFKFFYKPVGDPDVDSTAETNKESKASNTEEPTSKAATSKPTASKTTSSEEVEYYAGITRGEAINEVKKQVGTGAEILAVYTGYTPDASAESWVVVVSLVTTGDTKIVNYYVNDKGCYSGDSDNENDSEKDEEYSGITQAEACSKVSEAAGNGATVLSVEKGYTPSGYEAWVILIDPQTEKEYITTKTYYVGEFFCFTDDEDYDSSDYDIEFNDTEIYGGLKMSEAIDKARETLGVYPSPGVYDVYQGYDPIDGYESWIVVFFPSSTSPDTEKSYVYVSSDYAYLY